MYVCRPQLARPTATSATSQPEQQRNAQNVFLDTSSMAPTALVRISHMSRTLNTGTLR